MNDNTTFKKVSFYDWCKHYNRMDLNERFDCDRNKCDSTHVAFKSNLKYYFKCPRGLHDSDEYVMHFVTRNPERILDCRKCKSVAQVIIDKFGEEYLNLHWSDKNLISPWDVCAGNSTSKVIIKCVNKDYHEYEQTVSSFAKGIGCPYCINRKVHPKDSLASLNPNILTRWSNKNILSPYEVSTHSERKVWLKCPIGKHDDYIQKLNNAFEYDYRCPQCSLDKTSERMKNSGSPFWKGGVNKKNDSLRHHREYSKWRDLVYNRDKYTCQCCGATGVKLNAHHLNQFSDYVDIRYDVDNGITLCINCHDATIKGSFHNIYGTHNTTPLQLREYILNKCGKDIFITNPNLKYNL